MVWMWRYGVCVLTACGRLWFDPLGGGDSGGDGALRDANVSPCLSWGTWGTPVNLGLVNSASDDVSPSPSADELLLVFDSSRPGAGGRDLYLSQRASRVSPWEAPVMIASLSTGSGDQNPQLVLGDTALLFASNDGASNTLDLYTASRSGTTFGPRVGMPGFGGATIDEYGADISQDGLELVFARDAAGANGDLHAAGRLTTGDMFGTSAPISAANTANIERSPSLSPDGLELYFESDRASGNRIFRATRTSTTSEFGIASEIVELRFGTNNRSPRMSADGATMYFGSNGPGSVGAIDLFASTRPCLSR
jgi:hypothetical protein